MEFKNLLTKYNFSQTRLSRISGVSQSNLSIYCNYRGRLEASSELTRAKLASAFNMTLNEFEKILGLERSKTLAHNRQDKGFFTIIEREENK